MKELFGLTSAFRILSILPCWGENSSKYGRILAWSPVVGLVISLICTIPYVLFTRLTLCVLLADSPCTEDKCIELFISLLGAVFYVGCEAFLTRGFHLDGLADTFDGWGGGWTKENTLKIMRDSHIGSFGTIALIVVLAVKTLGVAVLLYFSKYVWLIFMPVFSRTLMVGQAAFNRYAREGESLAGSVVSDTQPRHAIAAVIVCIVVGAIVSLIGSFISVKALHAANIVPTVCLVLGVILTATIAFISRRRIEGVTGDVLGATVELNEALFLWSAALYCCLLAAK